LTTSRFNNNNRKIIGAEGDSYFNQILSESIENVMRFPPYCHIVKEFFETILLSRVMSMIVERKNPKLHKKLIEFNKNMPSFETPQEALKFILNNYENLFGSLDE